MNSKLTELRDRIWRLRRTGVVDQITMLEILDGIAAELERIEAQLQRTANVASCLANGIQPDSTMTEQEKLKHCAGCHDDFYNQPGNSGSKTGRCWLLPSMKLELRKEVSIDQRPPWNQNARIFPCCYHRPRFVYVGPNETC